MGGLGGTGLVCGWWFGVVLGWFACFHGPGRNDPKPFHAIRTLTTRILLVRNWVTISSYLCLTSGLYL